MAQIPSPDKDIIRQILRERQFSNTNDPITEHEASLLAESPGGLDKSQGRMNHSFSRTKVAATVPGVPIMQDVKCHLFQGQSENEVGDEEAQLLDKQHSLVQQLLAQQHELKRLEAKQLELVQLKKLAEERLVEANNTASRTIQTQSTEGTPNKMQTKYNLNEIPYEVENISDGNLVEYASSDDDQEEESLTIDSFQFEALQKKLQDIDTRQRHLEETSLQNQNKANDSFKNMNGYCNSPGVEEDEGYAVTGHANSTDYDELCGKVEELRERKEYMDKLLSFYNQLRSSNNESGVLSADTSVLDRSKDTFGEPDQRDAELLEMIKNFTARSAPERSVASQVEEVFTPGAAVEQSKEENRLEENREEEEKKLSDIQNMRDQLSRIQMEMSSVDFNELDSATDIASKLQGLEATRNRVAELRERLIKFEEVGEIQEKKPAGDEKEKIEALVRAKEKLQHLHQLASKVKEARAGGGTIPEDILNEISLVVPKEENVQEEKKEEKEEELNSSSEEKISSLLRRKLELETVQNELKQLRHQQQLLSDMDQDCKKATLTVPEGDRELLWESLREKQAAQLDRLKRADRFEADSTDGYTTRATWGGSSIRSLETTENPAGDDIEGGTYPDKTFEEEQPEEEEEGEGKDARLLYEIETNYWIEHCKLLPD